MSEPTDAQWLERTRGLVRKWRDAEPHPAFISALSLDMLIALEDALTATEAARREAEQELEKVQSLLELKRTSCRNLIEVQQRIATVIGDTPPAEHVDYTLPSLVQFVVSERERLQAQLAEAQATRPPWQPVATAPKGRNIALMKANGEIQIADWDDYDHYNEPGFVLWTEVDLPAPPLVAIDPTQEPT